MNIFNLDLESTADDSDEDTTYTSANSFDSLFWVSNEMGSIESKAGSTVDLPAASATKMAIDNCVSSGLGGKKILLCNTRQPRCCN